MRSSCFGNLELEYGNMRVEEKTNGEERSSRNRLNTKSLQKEESIASYGRHHHHHREGEEVFGRVVEVVFAAVARAVAAIVTQFI